MKKALIIIGLIIVLILILAALLPSTVHVERSISINAPVEIVFDQVNDLKKNFNWSPWSDYDPEMKVEWGETTSGLGASYSWSGNSDVGSGTLTIVESEDGKFIKNSLDFGEMGKGVGTWNFETIGVEQEDGSLLMETNVTWGLDSELDWPVGRFFGLVMDGYVGADFEKGLANLKHVCETLPVVEEIVVTEVDVPAVTVLTIKNKSSIDYIGEEMHEVFGELIAYVESNGIEITSPPLCIYHEWNTEENYSIYEAGIPVNENTTIEENDRVTITVIPAGRAGKVTLEGSYEGLNQVHFTLGEWVEKNGKQMSGSPWEVYLTDPNEDPNPANWITEVYYPIQ